MYIQKEEEDKNMCKSNPTIITSVTYKYTNQNG
jgi:hypothetical protein